MSSLFLRFLVLACLKVVSFANHRAHSRLGSLTLPLSCAALCRCRPTLQSTSSRRSIMRQRCCTALMTCASRRRRRCRRQWRLALCVSASRPLASAARMCTTCRRCALQSAVQRTYYPHIGLRSPRCCCQFGLCPSRQTLKPVCHPVPGPHWALCGESAHGHWPRIGGHCRGGWRGRAAPAGMSLPALPHCTNQWCWPVKLTEELISASLFSFWLRSKPS